MSWNYRIMKRKNSQGEFEYGIYEVYYDDQGKVSNWPLESMTPVCPSPEGLKHEMHIMLDAFNKETLDYKEE